MNTDQNQRNDRIPMTLSTAMLLDHLSVACDSVHRRVQKRWHRLYAAMHRMGSPRADSPEPGEPASPKKAS
jgi:hypothetical protein